MPVPSAGDFGSRLDKKRSVYKIIYEGIKRRTKSRVPRPSVEATKCHFTKSRRGSVKAFNQFNAR